MGIGKFRHRVTIQKYTPTHDSFGEEVKEWVDVCTVWAGVEPLRGREFFRAQTIHAEVTTRVSIRYRGGISPKMRVVFDGRFFDILSVINEEEKNKEIQLMCKEMITGGDGYG